MKPKARQILDEVKDHGSPARFKAIKKAKNPKEMAEIIVSQHGTVASDASKKRCKKCNKLRAHCKCGVKQ
jgi:hypothetical protein